jgi:hypothetical protein
MTWILWWFGVPGVQASPETSAPDDDRPPIIVR